MQKSRCRHERTLAALAAHQLDLDAVLVSLSDSEPPQPFYREIVAVTGVQHNFAASFGWRCRSPSSGIVARSLFPKAATTIGMVADLKPQGSARRPRGVIP